MGAWTLIRSGACVLALAFLVGCSATDRFRSQQDLISNSPTGKSQPDIHDNEIALLPGTVVGTSEVVPAAAQTPLPEGPSLPPLAESPGTLQNASVVAAGEVPKADNQPTVIPPTVPAVTIPPPIAATPGPELPAPSVSATAGSDWNRDAARNRGWISAQAEHTDRRRRDHASGAL